MGGQPRRPIAPARDGARGVTARGDSRTAIEAAAAHAAAQLRELFAGADEIDDGAEWDDGAPSHAGAREAARLTVPAAGRARMAAFRGSAAAGSAAAGSATARFGPGGVPAPPAVRISIGQITVQAPQPAPAPAPAASAVDSLADYLKRREEMWG